MKNRQSTVSALTSRMLWLGMVLLLSVQPVRAGEVAEDIAVLDALEDQRDEAQLAVARWHAEMDPAEPISLLTVKAAAAVGAGSKGVDCPGGGNVSTSCRDDSSGTLLSVMVTACRLVDDENRVLSVSGELLVTTPLSGACRSGIVPQCTRVSVRPLRYLATITDSKGTVIDTVSLSQGTPRSYEVFLPCDRRASR
jgi:hypothetical protein